MVLMTFMVALATAWKFANAYCGTDEMIMAADALVKGPLATNFWVFEIVVGLVLPCRPSGRQPAELAACLVRRGSDGPCRAIFLPLQPGGFRPDCPERLWFGRGIRNI